jgi:predicted N-acetyltransferase YhbS
LDDLWVVPEWIREGIGSRLFRHAVNLVRDVGASRMEWVSDPEAVGFYERMGARPIAGCHGKFTDAATELRL